MSRTNYFLVRIKNQDVLIQISNLFNFHWTLKGIVIQLTRIRFVVITAVIYSSIVSFNFFHRKIKSTSDSCLTANIIIFYILYMYKSIHFLMLPSILQVSSMYFFWFLKFHSYLNVQLVPGLKCKTSRSLDKYFMN